MSENTLTNDFFINSHFKKQRNSFVINIYLIEDNTLYGRIEVTELKNYWNFFLYTKDAALHTKIWGINEYKRNVDFMLEGIQYYLDTIND